MNSRANAQSLQAVPIYHPLLSGAIRVGLYCLYAKFPHTSAALDVDIRNGDVGIEPLVSLAHRHSGALELAGSVCDVERRHSTRDGIFSVLAGAYDHQPTQAGERNDTRDIRRLCLDTQSHVPRAVGSTLGLGRQPRHADPHCAGTSIHPAHMACTSSSGGACATSAIRPGLCSILPTCQPLVGAQKVSRPLSETFAAAKLGWRGHYYDAIISRDEHCRGDRQTLLSIAASPRMHSTHASESRTASIWQWNHRDVIAK